MIIDGKRIAREILSGLDGSGKSLAIVLVGSREDSILYTKMKKKKGEAIGLQVELVEFSSDVKENELTAKAKTLNHDGIIVQLPLPTGLGTVLESIPVEKDVDGLTAASLGKLVKNESCFIPATAKGVMRLFKEYGINLKGKDVVVVNHSAIVGKPLAMLFLNKGATVTACHEFTKDLKKYLIGADIIVSGVGKRDFITSSMIKEGVVLVDVGIVKDEMGLCGDFSSDCYVKSSYYTPVPGGVGPMTVAMLLESVVKGSKKHP